MGDWIEVRFVCSESEAEAWSDALMDLDLISVSLEDAEEGTANEQMLFAEPSDGIKGIKVSSDQWGVENIYSETQGISLWRKTVVLALCNADTDIPCILQTALDNLRRDNPECVVSLPLYETRRVSDDDWVQKSRDQFTAMQVSDRLWVVPSWEKVPTKASYVLRLDPGLAFGTGSHPTTQLCLRWLDQWADKIDRVLDYGCGSGILAIAAKILGARHVQATDIDAQALAVTAQNAIANTCHILVRSREEVEGQADLVLANILANPLITLAPVLVQHTKRGGHIVLSGILQEQTEEVIQAYSAYLPLAVYASMSNWVCLTGVRS